jgi:hypothetical protein
MHEMDENCDFLAGNLTGRDQLKDQSADWRIILKFSLKK